MTEKWVTAAQFARLMGCSRAEVTQSIKRGRIAAGDLRRDGRNQYINTRAVPGWQATSINKMPALAWGGTAAAAPAEPQQPDWQDIAARLNAYLGPKWPPPPWDADQVATVALCLSMATHGE
jgi:hypothetical protein